MSNPVKKYKLFYLAFILLLLFMSVFNSHAQTKSELEKRRSNILKEIDETENFLNNTKQSKTESLEKLTLLDRKITLRNSIIDNLLIESNNADKRIRELENITNSLSTDITTIKREYGRMIYLAYLNRKKNNQLMYILSAKDFNQAYKRILYIKQYSVYRKRQVEIIKSIQNELVAQKADLEQERKAKLRLVDINKSENKKLKNEVDEKTQLVNKLKSKEKELVKKLNEKNRIAEKLQKEIETVIKNELKRKKDIPKEKAKAVENVDNALGSSFNDNRGKLPWPIEKGIITSSFGEHPHPIYKNVTLRNNGIDISTKEGAEVKSIFSGEVKAVLFILGSNYSVIIRHGNFLSVYQNLVDIRVKNGDKVKTKQILGKVFTDDDSKSTVLHIEIWEELKKLNPEIWLSRR